MTAYKREGIPALKGRHNWRPRAKEKQPWPPSTRHCHHHARHWHSRKTDRTLQRGPDIASSAVLCFSRAQSSKLACPLTLLLCTSHLIAPQSRRTGLLTRLKRSILPAPLAGSIAEREAGSACSRGEEISSGAVSRRGMQSFSIMDSSYPCRWRKK